MLRIIFVQTRDRRVKILDFLNECTVFIFIYKINFGFDFFLFLFISAMIQRTNGAWPFQRYRFYEPLRFFSISALLSSLLASYPVAFQVVVIYDNIRIVSRIQSLGSCSVKWDLASSPSPPLFRPSCLSFSTVALSCHTSK